MNKELDKNKETIKGMFDAIAPTYDNLNHSLSLGIDKLWRKKTAKYIRKDGAIRILDIATGTGDLAISVAENAPQTIITGVDFSEGMLKVGRKKVETKGLTSRITLEEGDALELKYEDNSFDSATVGFGVRNFANLPKGLSEICRTLKPGAKLYVIELSLPQNPAIKFLYNIYFTKFLPFIGKIKSKNHFAYTYLPMSVSQFLSRKEFCETLLKSGYSKADFKNLSPGIATLYIATK